MDKNYNENRDKNPDQIIKKFGKEPSALSLQI